MDPARPGQCDAQRRRTRLYYCIEASRGLLFHLFIYPSEFFCCRIFGSVGGCRQLFSFQFLWESASYIRVSASVGVITTQFLYYFYYSCQLIGVASRSISVGLIGYFSLPEFLATTAILLRYCRLFSDIPGTKWCIINLFIPLVIFERGGVTQQERQQLRLLICFSQFLHFPRVRASGSVGRHASRFYWLRPCTFTSVEVTLRLLRRMPADAPSGDVGRVDTTFCRPWVALERYRVLSYYIILCIDVIGQ